MSNNETAPSQTCHESFTICKSCSMSTIPKSSRADKKGGGNKKRTQRNKGGSRGLATGN